MRNNEHIYTPMSRRGRHRRATRNPLVHRLGLEPPKRLEPGYWKTPDGFIAVNAGLIYDGVEDDDRLRGLVSFDPADVQAITKQRIKEQFPRYRLLDKERRLAAWGRVLAIVKQARVDRVVELVKELSDYGVELAVHSIIVHRVSNTFFVSLDVETLCKLHRVRQQQAYAEVRQIRVEKIAEF